MVEIKDKEENGCIYTKVMISILVVIEVVSVINEKAVIRNVSKGWYKLIIAMST